jgi:2,3-bisphosphoglycerate-dependent phosphoglycerate mutase
MPPTVAALGRWEQRERRDEHGTGWARPLGRGREPRPRGRLMATLVLLRHGESGWNQENRFTGWIDVDLSPAGAREARWAGELLVANGLRPDVAHTSLLRRTHRTAQIALDAAGAGDVPVRASWRLNERHYGALQGRNRVDVHEQFGEERFTRWRRSFDARPPAPDGDAGHPDLGGDYADVPTSLWRGESLRDVLERLLPYWHQHIVPDLRAGRLVLVVAHGNSLRALIKHMDAIDDEAVVALNVPTGIPLCYDLDPTGLRPTRPATYLDPDRARVAIERVANQGLREASTSRPNLPPRDGIPYVWLVQ